MLPRVDPLSMPATFCILAISCGGSGHLDYKDRVVHAEALLVSHRAPTLELATVGGDDC